jgi:tetratricopeptide (TPR) repeat protein
VGIRRLRGSFLATPPDPSPLQRADELHDLEDYAAALDLYKELQRTVDDADVRLEANYKQGVCLAALGRIDEAKTAFGSVVNADGDDWPPLAGSQLWVQALREKNDAEANAIFLTLSNRYQFEQLSDLLPPELHDEIIGAYFSGFDSYWCRVGVQSRPFAECPDRGRNRSIPQPRWSRRREASVGS